MKLESLTIFSMCSLYPRDERMLCPCFISKDNKVIDDMKRLKAEFLTWAVLGSGSISLYDLEQEAIGKRT